MERQYYSRGSVYGLSFSGGEVGDERCCTYRYSQSPSLQLTLEQALPLRVECQKTTSQGCHFVSTGSCANRDGDSISFREEHGIDD